MHPGAIAALEELDNEIFTGIERYLNIAKSQANHLNLMTEDMCVREFTSYVGILLAWYPHRKSLYAARMSRRRLLLTLRIELETAILKYIAEYPANNLSGATQNTMTQNVVSRGFIKLKPSILTGWQIMSDEKLVAEFHNGGFEYLFGLTDFKKSSESFAKRQAKLMQLHADLVAHDKKVAADIFPGAGEWLAELEALREVIIAGRATQWKFGDVDKYQL
jgi:hypothetical protein